MCVFRSAAASICVCLVPLVLCMCVYAFDGQRADKKCQRSIRPTKPVCQVSPSGLPAAATTATSPAPKCSQNGRPAQKKNISVSYRVPQPGNRRTDVSGDAIWSVIVPFHNRFPLFYLQVTCCERSSKYDLANYFVCKSIFALFCDDKIMFFGKHTTVVQQ